MDAASRALAVVDKAMAKGASKNPAWAAPAWRTTGTAQERLGDTKKALAAYEMALRLNPKMGVKRRIEALRKRQATSPKTSS
jgi:predicted TPR repeat methyltransferase